jgi:putative aldouronate transport system substrate-binding protein
MKKTLSLILSVLILLGMFSGMAWAEDPVVLKYYRGGGSQNMVDENNETFKRLHQVALEQANVDLQLELFDWGDNYNQTLMMHAAGGDLPSGVWTLGGISSAFATDIINQMGMSGMVYDWTDVVNDTENFPTLAANAEAHFIQMAICPEDGKLYGLPAERHGAYPHAPGGITIRKDWMEQLGMSYPTNEQELYDLIVAFHENFTNDAGNPVVPVSFTQFDNFTFWLNSWMGTCMWYQPEEGVWEYGKYANQAGLEKALLFLNKLWNEGLMDKESFSHTSEQVVSKGASSSFGVTSFSYGTTYSINDSFYATDPGTNKYLVSIPTMSCNPDLPAENVNSVEIISMPFHRTVITTNGIDEETFYRLAKVIDWIGTYDASLMLLMGFEGAEWEYEEGTDRKIRTKSWTENVSKDTSWQYKSGLCYWSSLNSNVQAMYDLLAAICVRASDVDSVNNIKGHQIAVSDPMNIVANGEVQNEFGPLIEDAWREMVIAAISANSQEAAKAIIDEWPATLEGLNYRAIVDERVASCKAFGLEL